MRSICESRRNWGPVSPRLTLVGRELERRWEEALRQQRHSQEDYDRFRREQPEELTPSQREAILRLSEDLPKIWHATTTTAQDRQEIVRLLLEKLVVNVEGDSDQMEVVLHWAGGATSCHRLVRPVSRYEQLSNYQALLDRIDELRKKGESCDAIAGRLNQEGFHPPSGRLSSAEAWSLGCSVVAACTARGREPWPIRTCWKNTNPG